MYVGGCCIIAKVDEDAVWSMQDASLASATQPTCFQASVFLADRTPTQAGGGEVLVDASHSLFSSHLNILHLARNSCAPRTKSPANRHYGAIVAPPSASGSGSAKSETPVQSKNWVLCRDASGQKV